MDLKKYRTRDNAESGASMSVVDPTTGNVWIDPESGKPCIIKVLGSESSVFQKNSFKLARKMLASRRSQRGVFKQAAVEDDESWEESRDQTIQLACELTVSWENVEEDGRPVECNELNKRRLYTEYRWLREQVLAFAQDPSNYLGN